MYSGSQMMIAQNCNKGRFPPYIAWARTLRMKGTRQRCQLAVSTFETAALMPSWASEMTSLTPRKPRRRSLRKNPSRGSRLPTGRCP